MVIHVIRVLMGIIIAANKCWIASVAMEYVARPMGVVASRVSKFWKNVVKIAVI